MGAGMAGKDVYREIKRSPGLGFEVFGFVDDDPGKKGLRINGSRVLGGIKKLKAIIKKNKIDEVIIAIPSANGEKIAEYIKTCSEAKTAFRIVPRVKEIIEGRAHVSTLRRPVIEDILGRPVVKSDVGGVKEFFADKTVLITGAAGSIGSELSRQVLAYCPRKIVFFDWWENGLFELQNELNTSFGRNEMEFVIGNIQDKRKVEKVFETYKPDYVFHAAAYKHVPAMEQNPEEAVKNNIFGTLVVAKAAKKYRVEKFVIVSTDKAACPRSVMGATKLVTEAIGRSLNGEKGTKFLAVRFGNVLGSHGSVVTIFEKQIDLGGPVTVTDRRMARYFMTIPEASQLIIKAAAMGKGGELFVLDMGAPIKIIDLAENMIGLRGLTPYKDIEIVFTGKRRGEKIREKLFNTKEKIQKTAEDRIFVTESFGFEMAKLPRIIKLLDEDIKLGDSDKIRKHLKKIIPSLSD